MQKGLWGDTDKRKKSLLLSIQLQAAVILIDENTSYDLLMASVWLSKKNASPEEVSFPTAYKKFTQNWATTAPCSPSNIYQDIVQNVLPWHS